MLDRLTSLGNRALTFMVFAGGLLACEAAKTPAEIYDDALESVVTLNVTTRAGESFVASGFVTGRSDVIATAWHVVHDARSVEATFADGAEIDAFRIPSAVDPAHDVALLRLARPHGRPVNLASRPARVASRVYVIGAPRGYSFSIVEGLVSQLQEVDGYQQYQISCPISPGNSGAPLIDDNGSVVGLVSWSKRGAQNLNFAVPASHVSAMLDAHLATESEVQLGFIPAESPVAALSENSERGAGGEWTRMQQHLSAMSGKSATVQVIVDGQVEVFDVVLPTSTPQGPMLVGGNLRE